MPGKRKRPRLRSKQGCLIADFYRLDGKRSTVSFGPVGERTEGKIYAAFGKWLDLLDQHPHKVLAFKNPYEAIDNLVNPATIVTIGGLLDKYIKWAEAYLTPLRDGQPDPDLARIKRLRKFMERYMDWPVNDFGPDELTTVQDSMVAYRYFRRNHEDKPVAYTRSGINQVINQIYKIWQWGIGREIATGIQMQRLRDVRPLRAGRTAAKDRAKRRTVTESEFKKVIECLTTVVADMVRLIWLTAMRPSEVCRMRPFDIVRDDPECWLYIPGRDAGPVGDHKTAYRQRVRAIPLTSTAQAILKPRMRSPDSKSYIFRPIDTVQEMRERRFAHRRTPMGQGNRAGTNRQVHPMITPGDSYNSNSLCNAVKRGCKRAGVIRFTPYDLRRTAATRVRSSLSKEDARLLLGHVSSNTTEIYLLDEVQETINLAMKLARNKP